LIDLIKILLYPFVLVYTFFVRFRNLFFDKGIYKVEKVNAKVISIGNLTVGGSGKTPTVIYVTKLLRSKGISAGILSRGYRRKSKGYQLVSDGEKFFKNVEQAGDEIYLAAKECHAPAAVCERRVNGAKQFIDDIKLDAIVLDDAYQHRWIHRDLNILLFDQRFLLKLNKMEQKLLPTGQMREPFDAVKRADIIIINRKFAEKEEIPVKLKKFFTGIPVFYSHYIAKGIYDVKDDKEYSLKEFEGQKSLVVCGIARPYSFLHILENNHINIENKLLFPDHKYYTHNEVQKIRKAFYDTNSHSVLTTQKDAVKLSNYAKELDDIDIFYLKIEVEFDDKENFDNKIMELFTSN